MPSSISQVHVVRPVRRVIDCCQFQFQSQNSIPCSALLYCRMNNAAQMTSTVHAPASAVAPTTTVSHLIIFNPDLKPAPKSKSDDEHEGVAAAGQPQDNVQEQEQELLGQAEEGSRDKDLEDDIKEASQIVFYTSRAAQGGRVSRDTMLRQFGLAKGMMGFTECVPGHSYRGKR